MRKYKQFLFAGLLALSLGLMTTNQAHAALTLTVSCEKGTTTKKDDDMRSNDKVCQDAKLGNAKKSTPKTVTCTNGEKVTINTSNDTPTSAEVTQACGKVTDPAAGAPTCTVLPQVICNAAKQSSGNAKDSGIFKLLIWVINILTGLVGIVAVGVLVYAGIMYASAGDNSQQISSAKGMITNTVIGIVAFALMFFALNWLIPGGVLN